VGIDGIYESAREADSLSMHRLKLQWRPRPRVPPSC